MLISMFLFSKMLQSTFIENLAKYSADRKYTRI